MRLPLLRHAGLCAGLAAAFAAGRFRALAIKLLPQAAGGYRRSALKPRCHGAKGWAQAALDAAAQPGLASLPSAPRQMVPEGRRLMPNGIARPALQRPRATSTGVAGSGASARQHA